jgi:hypothetical protein
MLKGLIAAVASFVGCTKQPSGRYYMEADLGSRIRSEYVRDRLTGQWIYREFELRVDTLRPLPDPISDDEHGDKLSLQLFKPGWARTGGLRSGTPVREDGYWIWRGAEALDRADVEGRAAYGVQVEWPREGEETRYDPMEVFPLDSLGSTEPGVWSDWYSAASMRPGAFGWWEEVHGRPADSPPRPEYPFTLRWRLTLIDRPGWIP